MTVLNKELSLTVHQMIDRVAQELDEAEVFFGHGTDNAWDEAVALVFQVLEISFDNHFEEKLNFKLTLKQQQKILKILDQRIKEKKPLPYLIHTAYFAGLPFYVDERVLIPRSPMAELIENAFEPWLEKEVHTILDLCTGSGCIAIACAKVFPEAKVDAVDISKEALEVAKINVKKHQVENQVQLICSDLFEQLAGKKYDIIISNPPYVGQKELKTLPEEYQWEPEIGLLTAEEGLGAVIKILNSAAHYLTEKGILIVEVGDNQERLEKKFPHLPFLWLDFERGEDGVFSLTKEQLV